MHSEGLRTFQVIVISADKCLVTCLVSEILQTIDKCNPSSCFIIL